MKNEYVIIVTKEAFEVLSMVAHHRESLSGLRYQKVIVNEPNMEQGDKITIIHDDKSIDAIVSNVEMNYFGNLVATVFI